MSTPPASDSRQHINALTTAVVVLGVGFLLGAAVFVTYVAWQHPHVVAPLGAGTAFLSAAAAIAVVLRRRP